MKTNKHTKKRLNPGFILLIANGVLIFSLGLSLSCISILKRNLQLSYQQVEELKAAVTTANKSEAEAIQALQDFKTEYYPIQELEEEQVLKPLAEVTETMSEPVIEPTKTLTVRVTAYCSCPKCCGVWSKDHPSRQGTDYEQYTTSGTVPTAGRTIAVDPDVIPLGSKVVLNGQEYVAEDTGSGVKGNHIDIYFDSHEAALDWGVKTLEAQIFEK